VDEGTARVERAIAAVREGGMVVVIDDPARENEGDLVMAAQYATAEHVNFMARYGRGLICVPMTPERLRALNLRPMVDPPEDTMRTAFTVSVDARHGITTGISAQDRARTIQVLIDPATTPDDLVRPGHVFPLEAKPGGVLRRPGHTEAAVDLARLAGLTPAGVICEIMNDDGTMMRLPDLRAFAERHGLPILFIADLVRYRLAHERLFERLAEATLPTPYGQFRAITYREPLTGLTHLALVLGDIRGEEPVLVRVHAECVLGDVFHTLRCACGATLERALLRIAEAGRGVLLYMRQEGRGIGLAEQVQALAAEDAGRPAVALPRPDALDYGVGAQILKDLGLERIRVLTDHPRRYAALEGYGITLVDTVPLAPVSAATSDRVSSA
jgi:3,4-dihydroxy 2-butanone 4-phosphate synthase/GTP cyclohydrolase II